MLQEGRRFRLVFGPSVVTGEIYRITASGMVFVKLLSGYCRNLEMAVDASFFKDEDTGFLEWIDTKV